MEQTFWKLVRGRWGGGRDKKLGEKFKKTLRRKGLWTEKWMRSGRGEGREVNNGGSNLGA